DAAAIVDDGTAPDSPLLKFDLLSGGPTTRSVPFERFTTSGVWGKPSRASAAKGEAILEIVVPLIREILRAHWPKCRELKQDAAAQVAPSDPAKQSAPRTEREVIA